jgi:hypothetical protein
MKKEAAIFTERWEIVYEATRRPNPKDVSVMPEICIRIIYIETVQVNGLRH